LGLLRGGEVMADGVRQNEVAIGEALHEGAGAKAIRAVIRKIRLAEHKEARHVAHQVVIHPEAAHGVMNSGIDAHRDTISILAGNFLIHVEEILIPLAHNRFAEPLNGGGEVEINTKAAWANAAPLIADFSRGARRKIARTQIAEARIFSFEEIIAVGF